MEFVGNKKTACFCGTPKCSGFIGEKPKDDKRQQMLKKKKGKKRSSQPSIMKITLQPPTKKRRRTVEEAKDPIETMLEKMPEKMVIEIEPEKVSAPPSTAVSPTDEVE
jgi:hypothetical protein